MPEGRRVLICRRMRTGIGMAEEISMKIKDFHTRVCAASDPNIGPLAASVGRGMRANLQIIERYGY